MHFGSVRGLPAWPATGPPQGQTRTTTPPKGRVGRVVRILSSYVRSNEDLDIFHDCLSEFPGGKTHLQWEDALEAFPDGLIPTSPFDLNGTRWQLLSRRAPDGRMVHLAVPASQPEPVPNGTSFGEEDYDTPARNGAARNRPSRILVIEQDQQGTVTTKGGAGATAKARAAVFDSPMEHRLAPSSTASSVAASSDDEASCRAVVPRGDRADATVVAAKQAARAMVAAAAPRAAIPVGRTPDGVLSLTDAGAAARRKYVRDIVAATNPAQDSLGRYKALTALIEHVKGRARTLAPTAHTDWGREPAHSVLHAIIDVGEALAGFGNVHFPERSGEARAVLAADYKALLSEYLTHVGGVLAPGGCRGISADTEAELRSVGGLLSTRCQAYKIMYEQLVSRVGDGGNNGRGGNNGGAACLIFNTNTNKVDACPVTNNWNKAVADAKARVLQSGIGGAAIAAAALGVGLLLRVLLKGRDGGGEAGGIAVGGKGRTRPLPKGRNGRELALVSALSACTDELRKAASNDSLLHDDWRLGRLRLAWPPASEPNGYKPLDAEVCDLSSTLESLYGR